MKKHIIRKSIVAVSLLLMAGASFAQSASSAYFMEGFNQRYQLNPAFSPERYVFLAVPGVIYMFQLVLTRQRLVK